MPGMSPAAWRSPVSGVACRAPRTSSGTAIGWPTAPLGERSSAQRFLAARLHRRAAVAFRPVPVARAGLVRRVARPAPGDGPGACLLCASGSVPVAATTRLGAGRPRTALAAPEPGFLCRPGGGAAALPCGLQLAPRSYSPDSRGAAVPSQAAAGLAALLLPGDGRWRAGCSASPGWPPGGRRRAPGALAHARPAAGPGPRPHP